MKRISITACGGLALGLMLCLTTAGSAQSPCQSPDEAPAGAAAAPSRNLQVFQEAPPEALRVFRELNRNPPIGRIVGGHLVAIENNPWQIAMVRASMAEPARSQFCGGSIIGNTWILTAAHCVRNSVVREDPRRVDVIVGTGQYAIGGERLKVAAIHTHPKYNQTTMDHDFALLRLQIRSPRGKSSSWPRKTPPSARGPTRASLGGARPRKAVPGRSISSGPRSPLCPMRSVTGPKATAEMSRPA